MPTIEEANFEVRKGYWTDTSYVLEVEINGKIMTIEFENENEADDWVDEIINKED